MSLSIERLTARTLEVRCKKVDNSILTALRRIIIAEVPSLGIADIQIEINTSTLFDDFLIQHLSFLPIVCDNICDLHCDCIDHKSEKKACDMYASIHVKNDTKILRTVFSQEIQFTCCRTFPNITILKLYPGEEFKASFLIKKGNGSMHAKFMPCSKSFAKPIPKIIIQNGERFTREQKEKISMLCPKKVFDSNLNVVNPNACSLCLDCVHQASDWDIEDAIEIQAENDEFVFEVKSIGTLPPLLIFKQALEILAMKLRKLLQEIK
jgi:DNA-directed RNA polymerase alpha subunit